MSVISVNDNDPLPIRESIVYIIFFLLRNWAQFKPGIRPVLYYEGPEEDWIAKIKKAGKELY